MSTRPAGDASQDRTARIIDPHGHASLFAGLREVWHHRDLLALLIRRDISVRYKQAVFGFLWALAQPIALAVVFTLFLHKGANLSGGALDYGVFAVAGLSAWTFFASGVNAGSESLVGSEKLISKVYFPRLAIPAAAVLSYLPDLGLSLCVLVVLMIWNGVAPGLTLLLFPLFLGLAVATTLGVALWSSALNVAYRDVKHAVPFLLQFWLFATPVVYTAQSFSGGAALVVGLNPATSVINGFRWTLLHQSPSSWAATWLSTGVSLVILATGLRYFHRVERYFADVI